ncbi:MAG: NUDIX domain-containing protein [Planctomycetota bacterium]
MADAVERWFASSARALPWRTTPRDPWLSLMSELLLQQTQVARVAPRFAQFVAAFPTPAAMAAAPVDRVLELWAGLGYYRRARLLHACATSIVERHAGRVPDTLDELLALPGVGRYTGGAVASIVFGQREPIVDGNITRVLLRLHGVRTHAADAEGIAWAWDRAAALANAARDAGRFNEGLMEAGATRCTPKSPGCDGCPLRRWCVAHRDGLADAIPLPKPRPARRDVAMTALLVRDRRGRVLLEPRPDRGLWAGLWQPPAVERSGRRPPAVAATLRALGLEGLVDVSTRSRAVDIETSHRAVRAAVWEARPVHAGRVRAARRRHGVTAQWADERTLATLPMGNAQRRLLDRDIL